MSKISIICPVNGIGRPIPKVTWWRDDVEINSTSNPSAIEGLAAIVNQLLIGTMTREYYGSKLQCRAQGSKLIAPVIKEVTIQVHCKYYFAIN